MNNTLLPPSAGAWMRNTETVTARLSAITVALRTLWTPTSCPVELLPYLAWALSVDRWDKSWPAAKKIEAIQQSYWLHRRKGTRAAVRRVIESMGFSATFAEWFETEGERGTFTLEIDVNDVGITKKTLDELNRLINDAKPVSRHISGINLVTKSQGFIYASAAGYTGDVLTTFPDGYQYEQEIKHDETIKYNSRNNHSGFYYD
ncbi:MAG TPA: phage tail protein I [Serratia grimesii]|uniref:Phage tail protein I n=1 Tax=Serratia grimesii TaxID=82995 RepID=A0A9C7QUE7_9GAMM|nr:phage tail protein I [Serratia grimesii]HCJ98946.1 phage tail protein I [Serratia grimesii]